jgi:hypothetical protein
MEEHRKLVTQVFSILKKEGLAVAAHKSFFHVREVEFLGYIINANGVEMSTRKVDMVRSWEIPKNLKDVQNFWDSRTFITDSSKTFQGWHDLLQTLPETKVWISTGDLYKQ